MDLFRASVTCLEVLFDPYILHNQWIALHGALLLDASLQLRLHHHRLALVFMAKPRALSFAERDAHLERTKPLTFLDRKIRKMLIDHQWRDTAAAELIANRYK